MADYQRIEQVLKHSGMSARALAFALGLKSPQIFYDIKAQKCGISKELATKIQDHFLNISAAWLLTGEGEMLKSEAINTGTVGNNNGNNNSGCVNVTQTIGDNSGQNAGRDINNPPCPNAGLNMLNELKELRHLAEQQLQVYASSLDKKDEQIRAAHQHIDTLIRQNQEQFSRFMSLLEDAHRH